ncbi:hypothetical protein IPN41_01045 [Candidatus Falkowbacteria bacterium]|nr:MAG: hypothetical protein IPN41_01045 [Candidatus Falkowbacteria bacterium]
MGKKEMMENYVKGQLEIISNPKYIKRVEEINGRKLTLDEVAEHYAKYDAEEYDKKHPHY